MASGSLCLHEERPESSLGSWVEKRVIYSCCTRPPGAPAPVPGTCHPAFCSDSIGIHESWWTGFGLGQAPIGAKARLSTAAWGPFSLVPEEGLAGWVLPLAG